MKEYMKIGDVFAGLVSNHDGELLDDNGFVADCYDSAPEKGDLIAHAINSHDELVQMNKELLEAIEFVMSAHGEQLDAAFSQAQEAIA